MVRVSTYASNKVLIIMALSKCPCTYYVYATHRLIKLIETLKGNASEIYFPNPLGMFRNNRERLILFETVKFISSVSYATFLCFHFWLQTNQQYIIAIPIIGISQNGLILLFYSKRCSALHNIYESDLQYKTS